MVCVMLGAPGGKRLKHIPEINTVGSSGGAGSRKLSESLSFIASRFLLAAVRVRITVGR